MYRANIINSKRFIVTSNKLRTKIIRVLKEQGFKVGKTVSPTGKGKQTLKRIQYKARLEQVFVRRGFLKTFGKTVRKYCPNGSEIVPEKISLELREVKPRSFEEEMCHWWNCTWWSIPYQHPYGRQMRFLLWDTYHNAPFGLIYLQSPILRMSVRDKWLDVPKDELDIWVNMSMNAQRLGSLPPYNQLLGGKMVALALTSNEVREAYKQKYQNYVTLMERRKIKSDLLFMTTTSAFGRSSIYNRLKFHDEKVAISLGFTQGAGSFHIPDEVYKEILETLVKNKIHIKRGYGFGPSRKLQLISHAFRLLKLPSFQYHGLKREFFIFPLVKNLLEVVQKGQKPIKTDRSLNSLVDFWKFRWALPRADRFEDWKKFSSDNYFKTVDRLLSTAKAYNDQKGKNV